MTKIKYKFKDETFLLFKKNGNIYMLYKTASPILNSTLILSNVDTVYVKEEMPSEHSEGRTLAVVHPSKNSEQLFPWIKELVFFPEIGLAIIYPNKK